MRERRRELIGVVTSDKMDKTVVVEVGRAARHALYGKVVKTHKKYKVHDADNACRIGDMVQIRECRPISKHKKFFVAQVLEHAVVV